MLSSFPSPRQTPLQLPPTRSTSGPREDARRLQPCRSRHCRRSLGAALAPRLAARRSPSKDAWTPCSTAGQPCPVPPAETSAVSTALGRITKNKHPPQNKNQDEKNK
uniref:Uncharacterized protein n=1 Tax=Columba livia TaxID=8932 RepID=R7VUE7_COLLI